MQEELVHCKALETTYAAQISFCENLLEQVKRGESMLLLPTVGKHGSHSQAIVTVAGGCVACGLPFVASDVVCVYTLACGDAYHALCFAAWVGSETECANPTCKQSIPISAKSMLVHNGWLQFLLVPIDNLSLFRMFITFYDYNFCGVAVGFGHMLGVPSLPAEQLKGFIAATPKGHNMGTSIQVDELTTPASGEASHVAKESTPSVEVEPTAETADEPEPKESKPMVQEGVDEMQHKVQGDAVPDSPIFLSEMVKKSKKRKKHEDGKWF